MVKLRLHEQMPRPENQDLQKDAFLKLGVPAPVSQLPQKDSKTQDNSFNYKVQSIDR